MLPFQFGLLALGAARQVLVAESVAALLFLVLIIFLQSPTAEQAAMALAISRLVALMGIALLCLLAVKQDSGRCPAPHAGERVS
jgi:hypothetical protein